LKTPDEFQSSGFRVLDWVAQRRASFLPVLIAVLVVVAAVYAYDYWSTSRQTKQWEGYQAAMKAPESERWDRLKTLYNDAKGSRAALFAATALADHYFDEAKKELVKDANAAPQSAVASAEWYAKALETNSLLAGEKQLLHADRASALEMEKKWDDAIAEYQRAAEMTGEGKAWAQLGVARSLEGKGETAKAIEAYEKVAADNATSEYGKLAKNSVRRLKSPLFETGPKS
jgi:hypothetical protein